MWFHCMSWLCNSSMLGAKGTHVGVKVVSSAATSYCVCVFMYVCLCMCVYIRVCVGGMVRLIGLCGQGCWRKRRERGGGQVWL